MISEYDDEVFTMDDLGNRLNVNLRSDTNEVYAVDANSNRYNSVGGNSLSYDAAGNLTTDADGYQYDYDYEGRIVRVTDVNDVNVAAFAYDALGRRVQKEDFIASQTRRYYYNNNQQVMSEYDENGTVTCKVYIYGNYIDEILYKQNTAIATRRFYVHDHLFSPVALMGNGGDFKERYEYDAYGNCTIYTDEGVDGIWLTADDTTASSSGQKNPYFFTGRRVDYLNNDDLKLQYSRNRYYSNSLGRFYQHDPLGITPRPQKPNVFGIIGQYKDGMSLYEYVRSNPVMNVDPWGLLEWIKCDCCKDIEAMKTSVKTACSQVDTTITDEKLRECIKKSCKKGKIICVMIKGKGPYGLPAPGNLGCLHRGKWWPCRKMFIYCPYFKNGKAGKASAGDTVIHEFAHGCGWNHGNGKGVPGDTGLIM